jgi:AhpD family alkylhydroperoxidase
MGPLSALGTRKTLIPNKYKELLMLAVHAETRCRYCTLFHTEVARMFGATDEEIQEAVHLAKQLTQSRGSDDILSAHPNGKNRRVRSRWNVVPPLRLPSGTAFHRHRQVNEIVGSPPIHPDPHEVSGLQEIHAARASRRMPRRHRVHRAGGNHERCLASDRA